MKKTALLFALLFTIYSSAFAQDNSKRFTRPHDFYPENSKITDKPFETLNGYSPYIFYPYNNVDISNDSTPQNEPSVKFSGKYPNVVVAAWRDFRTGVSPAIRRVGYSYSTDGGTTWSTSALLPIVDASHPRTSDPVVGSDTAGNFYIATISIDNSNSNGEIIVYKSTDGGVTFPVGYIAAAGGNEDKEWITCDLSKGSSPYKNNLYISWTRFGTPYGIVFSKSTNGGVNWTVPYQINSAGGVQGSCPAVGANGEIYVVWVGGTASDDIIWFNKSTNGGTSFVGETNIAQGTSPVIPITSSGVTFPSVATDISGGPRNGNVYVTWCDARNGDADVFMISSTNQGSNWSIPKRVNDDPIGNGKLQCWPWIAVNENGNIAILYFDSRNTTSNSIIEAWVGRSTDGGVTFINERLSSIPTTTNYPNTDVRFGDYINVDYRGSRIVPVWTDERAGGYNMEIYTSVIDLGPFFTHIPLGNTEQTTGVRPVNCTITPAGAPIDPARTKLYFTKNPSVFTDSLLMTNSGGNNWTANITMSGSGTYRYFMATADLNGKTGYAPSQGAWYSFTASSDTIKPVITHTPIGNTPKTLWPISVTAIVTDNVGVDSVWVRWYKNNTSSGYKQFKLNATGGNNFTAPFNSLNSEVNIGDSIYYRIIARDISANHNSDSTALYNFKIINLVNACVGIGTSSSNYPFTTYWEDGKTDMLYTASEITAQGGAPAYITKIGFNVITADPAPMNGFKVKLQNTALTTLTGFTSTGWTLSYDGVYTIPGTGLQYITLTTPFYWNGTSNLLIEICYNNNAYTYYSPVNASSISGMTWGQYTDLPTGDGCVAFTAGTAQAIRPNICLTMTPMSSVQNNAGVIPGKYSLAQNYPNPFNPVTKISFDIPKQGLVNLKVYDVLGREVRVLVNEVKAAGSYSIDFNATEFASGVYFYRIESNGFTDVKRMILIK